MASVDSTIGLDSEACAVIQVKAMADPAIKEYELRADTAAEFSACTLVSSDPAGRFVLPLKPNLNKSFRIRAALLAGGYGLAEGKVSITVGELAAVADLDWRVEQPSLVLTWPPVRGATQYAVWIEEGGVARFQRTTACELRMPLPKYTTAVRIVAASDDGRLSKPFDASIGVLGEYRLNEILSLPISMASGNFTGLAHLGTTAIERPDLTGPSAMVFPVADPSSASLYSFGFNLASTPGAVLSSIPGGWWRQGFWREREGSYESAPLDLGAAYTGVLKVSFVKAIEHHAAEQMAAVWGEYLSEFTAADIDDSSAWIGATLFASTSPTGPWEEVVDGQRVTCRYVRMLVRALRISPLTRVRITATQLTLDVDDIDFSGTVTMNAGTTHVDLTGKGLHVVRAVFTQGRGAVKTWPSNVAPDGFDINTDATVFPLVVNYFGKGY